MLFHFFRRIVFFLFFFSITHLNNIFPPQFHGVEDLADYRETISNREWVEQKKVLYWTLWRFWHFLGEWATHGLFTGLALLVWFNSNIFFFLNLVQMSVDKKKEGV